MTYIFQVDDEYLVVSLYALPLDAEQTDITTVWLLDGMQTGLFERTLGTLKLLE